jgi:hypothetical protein
MQGESSHASTGARRRARDLAVGLLAACTAFALVVAGLASALSLGVPGDPAWVERGVKLGMSEEQVKQSFLDGAAGDWRRATTCRGPSLEWTRKQGARSTTSPDEAPTRWARFELHDGWLVAMRLHVDDALSAPRAEQTASAVREDRPYEGGTATTIIARGCSTHAAEAERIALSALGGR